MVLGVKLCKKWWLFILWALGCLLLVAHVIWLWPWYCVKYSTRDRCNSSFSKILIIVFILKFFLLSTKDSNPIFSVSSFFKIRPAIKQTALFWNISNKLMFFFRYGYHYAAHEYSKPKKACREIWMWLILSWSQHDIALIIIPPDYAWLYLWWHVRGSSILDFCFKWFSGIEVRWPPWWYVYSKNNLHGQKTPSCRDPQTSHKQHLSTMNFIIHLSRQSVSFRNWMMSVALFIIGEYMMTSSAIMWCYHTIIYSSFMAQATGSYC